LRSGAVKASERPESREHCAARARLPIPPRARNGTRHLCLAARDRRAARASAGIHRFGRTARARRAL